MFFKMLILLFLMGASVNLFAQHSEQKVNISKELKEISGLEKLNDSVLIAINDGGNEAILYFINLQGEIIKKTLVSNAVNNDWEDLALDNQGNLYIADAGNNLSQRRDLCVLKVNAQQAFEDETIEVETIRFSYKYQNNFSPDKHLRIYDCEALYWHQDTLRLLTKIKSKPAKNDEFNGTFEYALPTSKGNHAIIPINNYWTGGDNRSKHQVTACDISNNTLFLLTYGFIYFSKIGSPRTFVRAPIRFKRFTQKEALVMLSDKKMIIAAERNRLLGGPYLYTISLE